MDLIPRVDERLHGLVRIGAAEMRNLAAQKASESLDREVATTYERLRSAYGHLSVGEVPGVHEARALYKALGIDPTKHRPSSEALLRRALRGQAPPAVNTLVDVVNLCSLRQQLPYGLYDAASVRPPTILRRGTEGEGYEGIRKDRVSVAGRPTLADAEGPFGNPTSDSARTMVTLGTTRSLIVLFAPATLTAARVEALLNETADAVRLACGGHVVTRAVHPEAP